MRADEQYNKMEKTPQLADELASLLVNGRLGHAYIFCGQEGLKQALAVAQAVNCLSLHNGQPCGVCPSCIKVRRGSHPDVITLAPLKDAHNIEAMRRLQAEAYLHSYEGGKKLFIIEGAELMLQEAANNLLKILEEPPEDTIFILVCANWHKLLPTIQSRCQVYTFGAEHNVVLDEKMIQELLPQAQEFLQSLPKLTLTQAMQESRHEEFNKEAWLHYLSALMRVLSQSAKRAYTLPISPEKSLTAALMLEQTIDFFRKNINQKLLLDIIYLRLWQYSQN
ncbi:MAG: hypothetical protein FWG43_02865 [Clostridiales bacterium]|nr:hypothetical protein [Clostridiales bacterium]